MYQQQKRELMERQSKNTEGFPGLIERVQLQPVIEQTKKASGKQKSSTATPPVDNDTGAVVKKAGRPKKATVI